MLQSLRKETEGKLQMLLSPRKNGLTSLFKEVRVFKVWQLTIQPKKTACFARTFPQLCTQNFSKPQSITQEGVHTHPLTAREREHWFLHHLSHFIAVNFGGQ